MIWNISLSQRESRKRRISSCTPLLLLLTIRCNSKPPKANIATQSPPPSHSMQCLPLYTLPRNSNFLEIFPYDILHPVRGRPAFRLALDGLQTSVIFSNLWCLICWTCPSHPNLSLIIALESETEPFFSHSLLFWSTVSPQQYPKIVIN